MDPFILILKPENNLETEIFCNIISIFKLLSEWKTLKSSYIQNLGWQFFVHLSKLPALKYFFNSISQNTQNILQYFWIFREVIYQSVLQ